MHKNYAFKSRNGKVAIQTSNKEIKDLLIAWFFVSLAFAIFRTGENLSFANIFSTEFLVSMGVSAVTVGIAFLLHELAHKVVAQRYNCWAEFRADINMLLIGVAISVLGVIFIAPGAVMIFGNITRQQNGKISMAGPLTNIIIAILMFPVLFIPIQNALLAEILVSSYIINAFLALFNMIPVWNLDGTKIYAWSKKVFFTMIITAAFLIFFYFVQA